MSKSNRKANNRTIALKQKDCSDLALGAPLQMLSDLFL